MDQLVEKLRRRDALSRDEERSLADVLGPPKRILAGSDLVREGDRPTSSTLLVEGFTARYVTLGDGGRQITELNVSGDFIDLHSFLMKHMDHGVMALTDCFVRPAPHPALKRLTEDHPHLSRLLWLDTIIDAAIHRQWIVSMGRRTALSHLAHMLCELCTRLNIVGEAVNDTFKLPLPQAVLADVLGLSTVHVNRLIAELRMMKLLTWSQGVVAILDWNGLTKLAEFDPTYLRLESEPV